MDVELYADPSCPWSWAAYLWLDRVSPRRQLRLVHRPFSLALRDGTEHLPSAKRRAREQAHRALRVATAIDDDGLRWAFFAAVTAPAFAALAAARPPAFDIPAAVAAVGLDVDIAGQADDTDLDARISQDMRRAAELLPSTEPRGLRIPLLVIGPPQYRTALLGPLLDPVPSGQLAIRLWDAVETVSQLSGMYEISRPRPTSHSLVTPAHRSA